MDDMDIDPAPVTHATLVAAAVAQLRPLHPVQIFPREADPLAMMPHISYHEYVLYEDEVIIHEDPSVSLFEFRRKHRMFTKKSVMAVEDGLLLYPGETEFQVEYNHASDIAKQITESMLFGLTTNAKKGCFFTDFGSPNVFVTEWCQVVFKDVSIVKPDNLNDFAIGFSHNAQCAHDVIKFGIFDGSPPPDIQELLKLMLARRHSIIWPIHASLVSMVCTSTMFLEMHELIREVLPKDELRLILEGMPYQARWRKLVATNHLLSFTYEFRPKSYAIPTSKEGQVGLSQDQRDALRELGLTPTAGQQELTEEQMELLNSLHFFDYLRNRTSHRIEPRKNWIANNADFNAQGSERISLVRFPKVNPYLQLKLLQLGRIEDLQKMKKLFGR